MGEGGTGSQDQIVARVGDKIVAVTRPGTDGDAPVVMKLINPEFKLATDADAKTLQTALDAAFPIMMDDDKKLASFSHAKSDWTFIRGKFFEKKLGFIFTTDDKGKIVSVKFSLGI